MFFFLVPEPNVHVKMHFQVSNFVFVFFDSNENYINFSNWSQNFHGYKFS